MEFNNGIASERSLDLKEQCRRSDTASCFLPLPTAYRRYREITPILQFHDTIGAAREHLPAPMFHQVGKGRKTLNRARRVRDANPPMAFSLHSPWGDFRRLFY